MDDETLQAKGISRRRVVTAAAGTAAVGAAAAIAVPAVTGHKAAGGTPAAAANTGSLPAQDWVIYLRNADDQAMDVFVGMQHFAVRDGDLVARLISAVKR